MSQHILIGKTLTGIELTTDRKAIRFYTTDGGPILARCDGDCCSDTWVEHVSLPARGFPAVVMSASDVSMPDLGEMPNRDVIAYYGFKLETDKGEFLIDYRNDSNGYYGGNLSWPDDEYFYGGVHGQNIAVDEWRSVTADE